MKVHENILKHMIKILKLTLDMKFFEVIVNSRSLVVGGIGCGDDNVTFEEQVTREAAEADCRFKFTNC
jgi:hypothetical protein